MIEEFINHKINVCHLILTNECDSKCGSCSYWTHKQNYYLDISKIEKIYYYFAKQGGEAILLTGGEPTLHPDFVEIVRLSREYGFITIVSTNGSRINLLFDEIKDYIDSYCISFDGDTRELYKTIRGVDFYPQIIEFTDKVKDYNSDIQIWFSCLIQKKNYNRLTKILKRVSTLKVNGIYFVVPEIRANSFGRKKKLKKSVQNNLLLTEDEINDLTHEVKEMFKLNEQLQEPKLVQDFEVISEFITYFKSFFNESLLKPRECHVPFRSIVITEMGMLKPCFYLPDEYNWNLDMELHEIDFLKSFWNEFTTNSKYKDKICKKCFQFKS